MRSKTGLRNPWKHFTGLVLCCGMLLLTDGAARASEIIAVPVDEARLVRLDKPVSEVIVGNPSIADVSVQNGQMLVVTGKSFGITNLIALDAGGNEVLNGNLRVGTTSVQTVRMHKGGTRFSYDCADRCEAMLMQGDNVEYFSALSKEARDKLGIAQSVVDGNPNNGQ